MALKVAELKTMRAGRHPDGRYGLYFNVVGNSRTWVQRLTIDGKRRNFGLGPWPVISLSEARAVAFENVRKRAQGINPIAARKRERTMPTFGQAVDSYIKLQAQSWKGGSRNEANWRSSLAHATAIADSPVDVIATDDIFEVVSKLLKAGKVPTAKAVRQRIRLVFEWCIGQGFRTDNPANGSLDSLFPRSSHRTTHHAAVPVGEVPAVFAKVAGIDKPTWRGMVGAMQLCILTACRTSEVLRATWAEIDFADKVWVIPASRMKAGKAHRIPLSDRALDVLQAARERTHGTGLVFRAPRGGKLDEAALRNVMKAIGAGATPHGFRGSFKSWCMESGVARELAEMSLAHSFMSDVEASYVRTDLLEKRRPVMQAWATHVTQPHDRKGETNL